MAILDAIWVFSDAQAQTSTGTHASTDIMDLGAANPNIGRGTPLWLTVRVNTAMAGASGTTFQVQVQDAADGSTFSYLWATSVGTAAGFAGAATSIFSVAAGTNLIQQPLPAACRRYLRVAYVIGTTVLTGGKWDAFITLGGDVNGAR
jgi:hypothetical protein